jgi:hypothetical protein
VERLFKQAGKHGEQSISNRSKLLNRVNECVLTDEFSFAFVLFAFFSFVSTISSLTAVGLFFTHCSGPFLQDDV